MSRKVFISFLGAIPYHDTVYYFDKKPEGNDQIAVPYVQQFIIESLLPNWASEDAIYIFTTKEAKKNNWDNRIKKFNKETNSAEFYDDKEGLGSFFEGLKTENKTQQYEAVQIPNGYTEKEVWQVFSTVFKKLYPYDEVYFDITYGFRSLPMLGIVLLNYAKTLLKPLTVKAIYYGNYEAGRDKERTKDGRVIAPVLNFLSFVELQTWTQAADNFINLGDTQLLSELIKEDHEDLGTQLHEFTKAIRTSRGAQLINDFDMDGLKKLMSPKKGEGMKVQLKPLLEKINEELSVYRNNEISNGFKSVEWCIKYNLVAQGYTLLQETIKTWLVEKVLPGQSLNKDYRRWTDIALNGIPRYQLDENGEPILKKNNKKIWRWQGIRENQKDKIAIVEQMIEEVMKLDGLRSSYKKLTGKDGLRNDINHGGFNEEYFNAHQLTAKLAEIYKEIKTLNLFGK